MSTSNASQGHAVMELETVGDHQGQPSFRIRAGACTYVYHIEGCGFASIYDKDGNDWITYKPEGGPHGHFRGIPNMGLNMFGHPGYAYGATSSAELRGDHVYIHSTSVDGAWDMEWKITENAVLHRVNKAGADWWWLYEGTPGGHFKPDAQNYTRSNGTVTSCSDGFMEQLPSPPWVAFSDPASGRSLLLASMQVATVDQYYPMGGDGGMTVLGFGRSSTDETPLVFHFPAQIHEAHYFAYSMCESTDTTQLASAYDRLVADIAAWRKS